MNFLHVYEAKTRAGLPNKHYYTTGGGTTTYYVVLHIVQLHMNRTIRFTRVQCMYF